MRKIVHKHIVRHNAHQCRGKIDEKQFPEGAASPLLCLTALRDRLYAIGRNPERRNQHKICHNRVGIPDAAHACRQKNSRDIGSGNKRKKGRKALIDHIKYRVFYQ